MGYNYNLPEFKIVSGDVLNTIHELSLKILKDVGVKIPDDEILEFLYLSGAQVNKQTKTAKFPEELVMKCIKYTGKKHILYGRDRSNKAEFGLDMFNFNGSSGQFLILDKSGKRRRPLNSDLDLAIKIGEHLKNINVTGALVIPHEIPQQIVDIYTFYRLLTSASKPFTAWIFSGKSAKIIIEMMQIVAGSSKELQEYPFYETFVEPISPLSYRQDSLCILKQFAAAGLPVGFSPMVQVGATGPLNLLGAVAQENAEILSGIVISQVLKKGLPVSYGGISHIFDMKNQTISFGSPEQALMAAALTQLGRFYGLPVYSNTFLTDSNMFDLQYGLESAATLSFGSLSHGDIFGHLGICGADSAASFLKLIIDDEIAGYFIRLMSGFSALDSRAVLNEINSSGIGGNFLLGQMTLNNFRKEIWYPEIMVRQPWNAWESGGKKNTVELAEKKLNKILSEELEHPCLDDGVLKELKNILKLSGINF